MGKIVDRYRALIAAGELRPDTDQEKAAARLDRLAMELGEKPKSGGFLKRLFGKSSPPPRGVYLWGSVGRGKSMLMDLFHECVDFTPRRRVHFHEFMLEVHERLHVERAKESADPIQPVAAAIAGEAQLLCFDEMIVNNSADAMILSRLFTALIDHDVVVVTTSNRPPHDLYKNGLNREHFLPFIALVEDRLDVLSLNGPVDYRMDRLGGFPTYYVPNGKAATDALRKAFFRLTDYPPEDSEHVPSETISVPGNRSLFVPKSLKGVAVFSFKRLCAQPLGVPDYLAIARRYHTVIIVGVPVMGDDQRNEAVRFKTLIDTFYEHHVKLLMAADAEPAGLYIGRDDAFEFERTISRLMEMQSAEYLQKGHGNHA